MEAKENATIPYFVHEGMLARTERNHKRLIIALIVSIVFIFVSNALWLYAWMQFEYVGEEVTVDGTDGIANYINQGGTITNGEGDG